jgi:hypothetical protein
MYERFISSSMLTGMRLLIGVVMNLCGMDQRSGPADAGHDASPG